MIIWNYSLDNKEKTYEQNINIPFHFKISYFFIEKWNDIRMYENASLYLFYIIEGKGYLEDMDWKEGDLVLCPYQPNGIQLCATEETKLICIHNFPFLESMGVKPYRSLFESRIIKDKINSEHIKKIRIPPQSKQYIKIKKDTFFISISQSSEKVFSFLNNIENIYWENGVIVFFEKEDIILIENRDMKEHYFLSIE